MDRLWHLALPAVALAAGLAALVVKMTRTAVLAELEQDYVTFARARGLPPRAVTRLYLTNAAIPIVTSAGLLLAFLFGGTILVEVTYALPGSASSWPTRSRSRTYLWSRPSRCWSPSSSPERACWWT